MRAAFEKNSYGIFSREGRTEKNAGRWWNCINIHFCQAAAPF